MAADAGHAGVGVAGADGELDPVVGVFVVEFAVRVAGQGNGFREVRERFRLCGGAGFDEDDLGCCEHAGVHVGGQAFDGGDDGAGLLDADHPVVECGGQGGQDWVCGAAGGLYLGEHHFRGVHPGPGVRGGDRQGFAEQRDGGRGPEARGGVPGVDLPGQPDLGGVPEPGEAFDGLGDGQQVQFRDLPQVQSLQRFQGGARDRDLGLCRVEYRGQRHEIRLAFDTDSASCDGSVAGPSVTPAVGSAAADDSGRQGVPADVPDGQLIRR